MKDSEQFIRQMEITTAYQKEFGYNKGNVAPQKNILTFIKIKDVRFLFSLF